MMPRMLSPHTASGQTLVNSPPWDSQPASHSGPACMSLLYAERAAAHCFRCLVTFTLRIQLPFYLESVPQSDGNTFPKNSQTQHNLLFCASEDLWGYEVCTSRQLQPTWKCLRRRLKSDKEAEWDSQREPASHSAFPVFTSPQFRNTIFFNLQRSALVLWYTIQLNIFPGASYWTLSTVDRTEQTQCLPAVLLTNFYHCQAHSSKWRH